MKVSIIPTLARKAATVAAAFLFLGTLSAEARPRHAHHTHQAKPAAEACFFFCPQQQAEPVRSSKAARRAQQTAEQFSAAPAQSFNQESGSRHASDTVVGGRPTGCPSRWCGCQASIEIFGKIVPYLNLAANWLRSFPHVAHSAGAPGMAAARPGHVVVLREHIAGNRWIIKDGNYAGAAHIREADLSSYTIVDPRGGKLAMN